MLGFKDPVLFFNLILHLGTLCATFIVFRREIFQIILLPRAIGLIIVASLPTAVMGFALLDIVEQSFGSVRFAGVGLLITGTWLWLTRYTLSTKEMTEGPLFSGITFKKAFLIGIAQGIALFPGISRSGSTIATALFLKLSPKDAGTFSFILSIPAIIGAFGLKMALSSEIETDQILQNGIGFLWSFMVGIVALLYLIKVILRGNFFKFSYYCWLIGAGAIILGYL